MKRSEINQFIIDNGEQLSNREIGAKCGLSRNAVSARRVRLKQKGHNVAFVAYVFESMEETVGEVVEKKTELKKQTEKAKGAEKENKFLYEQIDSLEEELQIMKHLESSTDTHKIVQSEPSGKSEATAVALVSDWHVECEVRKDAVNGLNKYNLDIAKIRADECFQRIARFVRKEQQDVVIKELIVWLGGDFIDGRLRDESLETALLGVMPASIFAQELLESGLKFLLENTDLQITVVTSVGNHSRITMKISSARECDNAIETLLYHQLSARLACERMKFIIKDSYHTYVDVYGYVCRFHHGTRVRYMGAMGGIHTNMVKKKLTWDKGIKADFDFLG